MREKAYYLISPRGGGEFERGWSTPMVFLEKVSRGERMRPGGSRMGPKGLDEKSRERSSEGSFPLSLLKNILLSVASDGLAIGIFVTDFLSWSLPERRSINAEVPWNSIRRSKKMKAYEWKTSAWPTRRWSETRGRDRTGAGCGIWREGSRKRILVSFGYLRGKSNRHFSRVRECIPHFDRGVCMRRRYSRDPFDHLETIHPAGFDFGSWLSIPLRTQWRWQRKRWKMCQFPEWFGKIIMRENAIKKLNGRTAEGKK